MTRVALAGTLAFALLSGCAHSSGAAPAAPVAASAQTPNPSGKMMPMCPMDVPGARVSATDTADGETLTFTADDRAAEVRSRVHAMAEMHNRHNVAGEHGAMMGGGKAGGPMMPPSHATVADVDDGASITVTPDAPADLQKVQTMIRMHAERMQKNGCAMMGHGHEG